MLNAVILSVIALNVYMLKDVRLIGVFFIVMLSVVLLNVAAPYKASIIVYLRTTSANTDQ